MLAIRVEAIRADCDQPVANGVLDAALAEVGDTIPPAPGTPSATW